MTPVGGGVPSFTGTTGGVLGWPGYGAGENACHCDTLLTMACVLALMFAIGFAVVAAVFYSRLQSERDGRRSDWALNHPVMYSGGESPPAYAERDSDDMDHDVRAMESGGVVPDIIGGNIGNSEVPGGQLSVDRPVVARVMRH